MTLLLFLAIMAYRRWNVWVSFTSCLHPLIVLVKSVCFFLEPLQQTIEKLCPKFCHHFTKMILMPFSARSKYSLSHFMIVYQNTLVSREYLLFFMIFRGWIKMTLSCYNFYCNQNEFRRVQVKHFREFVTLLGFLSLNSGE